MGFRSQGYVTVWAVESVSDTFTKGRVSSSRKDKRTGEYVTDFSGYVGFMGTAAASAALKLKERDRIKLGDVDVKQTYDKNKGVTYTNFNIYSFELANGSPNGGMQQPSGGIGSVDQGEIDLDDFQDDMPWA